MSLPHADMRFAPDIMPEHRLQVYYVVDTVVDQLLKVAGFLLDLNSIGLLDALVTRAWGGPSCTGGLGVIIVVFTIAAALIPSA